MPMPLRHPAEKRLRKEDSILYLHVLFLCSGAIAILSTAMVARATDSERCQELGNRLSAIEVSLALFSAADDNCTSLATERGADPSLKDNAGKRAVDLTTVSLLREQFKAPCRR
ncbi:hypothetical protein GPL21_05840 [Bradyrhizobium pachyrhizi]|uniref:Uncharacterized protein n=1 Tax=Bradyrhizobium pachyrhizi TaxID=280333 RepID=A0A844SGF6_9BRAD|nr:hypothetical protein [Bradyrhizobium pachyrhizi]MVT64635.1 hypothetical protein [Bradyrhizobium pachyrhizi]